MLPARGGSSNILLIFMSFQERWEALEAHAGTLAGEGLLMFFWCLMGFDKGQFAEAAVAFLAVLAGATSATCHQRAVILDALAQCALGSEQGLFFCLFLLFFFVCFFLVFSFLFGFVFVWVFFLFVFVFVFVWSS